MNLYSRIGYRCLEFKANGAGAVQIRIKHKGAKKQRSQRSSKGRHGENPGIELNAKAQRCKDRKEATEGKREHWQ
jgi:hypothetical protein